LWRPHDGETVTSLSKGTLDAVDVVFRGADIVATTGGDVAWEYTQQGWSYLYGSAVAAA
jgi:hypothetical protein